MGKTYHTMIYHNVYKTKVILFSHTYKLFHRLLFHIKNPGTYLYDYLAKTDAPNFMSIMILSYFITILS